MDLPRRILRRLRGRRSAQPGAARWTQQEQALPPCPPGWSIGPPDFVGVGAQKAGTTWWFRLIAAHPGVHHDTSQRPELHFWDRFSHRWPTAADIERYHRHFPRPPSALAGEKTPEYMVDYWVPPMLREAAPDARIIVLLRDPIERYLSGWAHGTEKGWARDRNAETATFERGLYGAQLARLRDFFAPGQVLVLQYERCVADPRAELARTYEFLGLPAHALSEDELKRSYNVSHEAKLTLDPARMAALRRAYASDVRRLVADHPDIDLRLWPNFGQLE